MDAFRCKKRKLNIKSIVFYCICALVCVAFCVVLSCLNVNNAVALEQEIRCGIKEHTHTDSCYDGDFLVCEEAAHSHDGNCYLVLLKDNDINEILTLLGNNKNHSLEYVISDTMSSALTYNENLNSIETNESGVLPLSRDTVAEFNDTISVEEELPNLVFNEDINNAATLITNNESETTQINNTGNTLSNQVESNITATTQENASGVTLLSVGDESDSSDYQANFYVYLDNKWTCIGNLTFSAVRSGIRYNSTIPTSSVLNLINDSLGTNYAYNSFGIAVSTSENGNYTTSNMTVTSATTTVGYRQTSTAVARTAKYVRIIPRGATQVNTNLAFYTVKYVYPDGKTETFYVNSGSNITLPSNYVWESGNSTYSGGDSVKINAATIFTATTFYVNIEYDIDFPVVSGVTVSNTPTLSGLATTTVTDRVIQGSDAVIRNVSQHSVQGKVNNNSTGLTRVIQFRGWKVGSTDIIIQPNTHLIWEELAQYYNENETDLVLTAVWEYSPLQTASFFIRFDSVAVDTDGNVTGQDSNKYTKQIFAAYVGGVDTNLTVNTLNSKYQIADTTSDNSFGADQAIRALYGERAEGVWLSAFPSDEFVFENLVQYANTGYLSVDGIAVKAEDLSSKEYAIRWYVFKSQDDAWHIDGKLVRKEGLIHVYKTFAGNKELITEAKTDFYIDATDVSTGVNTVLDLNNYTSHNDSTDTYMWEIKNVDYGEYWTITEHPHKFTDEHINFSVYSEYTIMDAHGDQSVSGSGTSLTVSGMTYALDEGIDEVLRAEFTNIYNRSDSIIIKKQDSLTGVSISGAVFQLYQNNKLLKFSYNAETDRYEFDNENGTVSNLSGNENGYYEICIDNFSYDLGPIVIKEIKAPTGYTPIGDIEIGYTDDGETVGILSGNSELIKYMGGVLVVGNSTDSSSVTVKKNWDCPENEWQPVTVQLLANGKLVTTVIAGVEPQVVLNTDNNWQHTWDNLPVYVNGQKISWSVKETLIGTEPAKADGSFVNWLVSYELPVISTDSNGNENTLLTVTNTTKRVMLRLTKTDLSKTVQLPGASFILEAVDKEGNLLTNEVSKTATTGEAGTLIFDNMKTNIRYRLTELEAPSGYLKTDEYIYFTINEDGSVAVEESFYAEPSGTAYNIIVRNAASIYLPVSGSVGTGMFYAVGLLLMAVTFGIYIGHLRKRRCQH